MAHIEPAKRETLPQFEEYFGFLDGNAGFVPNSFLTMARLPHLFEGYIQFSRALGSCESVERQLKVLMSHVASISYGCRFCEAHSGSFAIEKGIEAERVAKVWEFETSDLFSEAERSALRFARDMGAVPNAVTADHFTELRQWYTDDQIVEMVASVCMFAFWNRWNDTMATDLERPVYDTASAVIAERGWEPGKFAVEESDAHRVAPQSP